MKRFRLFLTMALCLVMLATAFTVTAFAEGGETGNEPYTVEVKEENNLAMNKFDWEVDKIGSASTTFSENGIRFESFNKGGSPFAIYKTNKMNEFKYSMYAKLNLTRPSECGLSYDHDYSNLYISFQINANEPIAAYTCPWNGNKANFSVCFENLQGFTKTQLYLNESYIGNGAERRVVKEDEKGIATWNDGEYHWYEFTFVNDTVEEEYRGETYTRTGKRFTFYFDGQFVFEYFQRDQEVYSKTLGEYVENANFSKTSGYIGFWPSSDFPVGANTDTTNCFAEIQTVQIISYDNGNTEPYAKCAAPDFPINVITYSPAASYETEMDIEIKLEDLFSYEGDEEVTYSVTCSGKELGRINNGYWIWMPEEAGRYYVDVKASVNGKEAVNYLTINVVAATAPVIPSTSESTAPQGGGNGCNGGIGASAFGLIAMAAAAALKRGKRA